MAMKTPTAKEINTWYPESAEDVRETLKGCKILYASNEKERVVIFDDHDEIYISYRFDKATDDSWFPTQCYLSDVLNAGLVVEFKQAKAKKKAKKAKK